MRSYAQISQPTNNPIPAATPNMAQPASIAVSGQLGGT
jgi:hypothetical protein